MYIWKFQPPQNEGKFNKIRPRFPRNLLLGRWLAPPGQPATWGHCQCHVGPPSPWGHVAPVKATYHFSWLIDTTNVLLYILLTRSLRIDSAPTSINLTTFQLRISCYKTTNWAWRWLPIFMTYLFLWTNWCWLTVWLCSWHFNCVKWWRTMLPGVLAESLRMKIPHVAEYWSFWKKTLASILSIESSK